MILTKTFFAVITGTPFWKISGFVPVRFHAFICPSPQLLTSVFCLKFRHYNQISSYKWPCSQTNQNSRKKKRYWIFGRSDIVQGSVLCAVQASMLIMLQCHLGKPKISIIELTELILWRFYLQKWHQLSWYQNKLNRTLLS